MGMDAATPPGLWERIRDLVQTEVSKLLRSGLLRNASISDGGLTIRGGFLKLRAPGATADTLYVGGLAPNAPDGKPQPGVLLTRNDGTTVLKLWDASPGTDGYFQHLVIFDRAGNSIFSEDATTGQGIGRPYLPIHLVPGLNVNALPVGTMSGTFEAVWIGRAPKQQPKLFLNVLASTPGGVVGEVRLVVNGTQLGPTQTAPAGATTDLTFGPIAVDGAHMATLRIDIDARVVSGIGRVAVHAVRCEGRQS